MMFSVALVVVAGIGASPTYEWSTFKLPPEIISRPMGRVDSAFSHDGSRLIVVTCNGGCVWEGDRFQKRRSFRRDWGPRSVAWLDHQRLVATEYDKLLLLSADDGHVIQEHRLRLIEGAALMPSGLVAATTSRERRHADDWRLDMSVLIAPETGQVVVNCGDGTGPDGRSAGVVHSPLLVVRDTSGTRFAGASRSGLWIADIYTQQTRSVVCAGGLGVVFSAACFDPSGRYLVAGHAGGEIFAFDLLIPHFQLIDRARKTPCYLGKFGDDWKMSIIGLGFVGNRWLWFSNRRELYFCSWPDGKVVRRCTPPGSDATNDRVWVGTRDGSLLAGVDKSGIVRIGRLKTESKKQPIVR